jgi:DivIVA domain-containing protein
MPEGLVPISSSRVATGDIARHSFAMVRRGFDPDEVKAYLQSVARSIETFEQREQELREAMAAAEERAAHPVVDEATLTASLGQHSAQILRQAHEEAARIVVQAQEGASTLLREVQAQANEIQAHSEIASAERVAEAELMVAEAEKHAREQVDRIRSEAIAQGEEVIARAKDEGRSLLEQVQESRRQVLTELAARRKTLSMQIEQLRAARDEMAAAVQGVRASMDVIIDDLGRTDDQARAAALAAGDQARLHGLEEEPPEADAIPEPSTAVEATEPATHEAGANAAAEPEGENAPTVDALFARIRAGSDEDAPADEQLTLVVPAVGPKVFDVEGGEAAVKLIEQGPDDDVIAARDEALNPIITQLARHLKRALGDDQNRMLEILRTTPAAQGEALLGPEDIHLAVYLTAAEGHIADACTAGLTFGGAVAGAIFDQTPIEQSTSGLARTVVTMLRRRIDGDDDGGEEAGERVSAAFREWRGERIERLVGDFAVQAFSAGVSMASPDQPLRWVLTSTSGCSDCDDNALAGAVSPSEGFPTGHAHPPAHSGCRCLIAPAHA